MKNKGSFQPAVMIWTALFILLSVGFMTVTVAGGGGKYMGADKCKNCHNSKDKGDAYAKWKASKHAKAFETLGTAQAKEAGAKLGVTDPQKDAKCLKCHVTAAAEAADKKDAKFDMKQGVGCETCHGPGEGHVKARLAAAAESEDDAFGGAAGRQKLPAGEIVAAPKEADCLKCHNKESPTYKEFKYADRAKEISHKDPRPPAK